MLAEPTAAATFGAILGDFAQGIDLSHYPVAIQAAVERHRAIDRFTDSHPHRRQFLPRFSKQRRRFAPVALDVYDDHLLITHWQTFYNATPLQGVAHLNQQLRGLLQHPPATMPPAMQRTVQAMVHHRWFEHYQTRQGVADALDQIAKRIRFANEFSGMMQEIDLLAAELEHSFLAFYPALLTHVQQLGDELTAFTAKAGPSISHSPTG